MKRVNQNIYVNKQVEPRKLEIIEELKDRCRKLIKKKELFSFLPEEGASTLMIKAMAKLEVEGYVIRLRYNDIFDTPFMDEQDMTTEVKSKAIIIEEEEDNIPIHRSEVCKLMYMLLHPANQENGAFVGNRQTFYLQDLAKNAEEEYDMFELQEEARKLIRELDSDQVSAAYYLLNQAMPVGLENKQIRMNLIKISNDDPEAVLDAFEDEKTQIIFRLRSALDLGHVYLNGNNTELYWKRGNGKIITIPSGTEMDDEFANFVMTSKQGREVYERIETLVTQ